jgi:hypothetical protein
MNKSTELLNIKQVLRILIAGFKGLMDQGKSKKERELNMCKACNSVTM